MLKTNQRFNARKVSANKKNRLLQHRCLVSSFVPVLADTWFEFLFVCFIFLRRNCSDVCGKPSSLIALVKMWQGSSFCSCCNSHRVLHSRELRIFHKCIQSSLSHSCERIRYCESRINSRRPQGITYAVFSKGSKQLLRSKRVLRQEQWESQVRHVTCQWPLRYPGLHFPVEGQLEGTRQCCLDCGSLEALSTCFQWTFPL